MTLKKEISFDLTITFLLWIIYTVFTDRGLINFGLSSFLFGAPYFLATIKNFFTSTNDDEVLPGALFLIYSGVLLSCAFILMMGKCDFVFIGFGSVWQYPVSHNTFFTFFLSLGAYPLVKLF